MTDTDDLPTCNACGNPTAERYLVVEGEKFRHLCGGCTDAWYAERKAGAKLGGAKT